MFNKSYNIHVQGRVLFLKNASSLSIINSFLLKTITVDSKPFPIELELKKLICYRIKKINCSKKHC